MSTKETMFVGEPELQFQDSPKHASVLFQFCLFSRWTCLVSAEVGSEVTYHLNSGAWGPQPGACLTLAICGLSLLRVLWRVLW